MDTKVALRDRIGFDTLAMRNLYRAVFPFFHCRCRVPAFLKEEEPVIFVANHYEVFGPLAMATSLPVRFRLWTTVEMLEPYKNIDKTAIGVHHTIPWLPIPMARKLYRAICPLIDMIGKRLSPLPVYRDDPSRIMTTVRGSVEAMVRGESLLIFPEDGLPRYSNGGVTKFMPGFALVGEMYRRKTGKDARFCPVYVDKKRRRIIFGEPVTYGRGNPTREIERMSELLHDQLARMAAEAGFRADDADADICERVENRADARG